MRNLKKYFKGFTLVELIIVITILTILGTISFISFQDYFADSRDANRVTTISNIKQSLDLQKMKTRKYPTPAQAVSYTGGNTEIQQGVINKEILSDMSNDPKDPGSGEYYTYSILENGKYYQIAAQLENEVGYKSFVSKTYADDYESVKVEGNYRFDPSFPSLIIVPSSYTSGSGIFAPSVCFVLDGGANTLTTCNQKKSEMNLKEFDTSLVGYWDMETLSGTKLKDLSGNGNDGTFSGGMVYSSALTGGVIGKGMNFNGDNIIESINRVNYNNSPSITITVIINSKNSSEMLGYTGSTQIIVESSDNFNYNTGSFIISDFDKSNSYFNEYRTNFAVKYKVNPIEYYITRSTNKSTEGFKIVTLVSTYGKNGKETFGYINGIKQNNDKEDPTGKYKVINKSTEDRFIDYNMYIGNRKNYYGYIKKLGFLGIIDDVKIYNRALSDEEIAQQAKIAGF